MMTYSVRVFLFVALVTAPVPVGAQPVTDSVAAVVTSPTGPASTSMDHADTGVTEADNSTPEAAVVESDFSGVSDFGELDLEALLDTQVETASKKAQSISRAPAIIDVLTRSQLYDLGARSLYDALTFLPGIELIENYSGTTTLIFRGVVQEQYSVKILLLVNGHPVYEPVTSQFLLETIPLEAIRRVEVIRGPGSVLYGTNAFAGVINLITESAEEDSLLTLMRVKGGSFGTVNGAAGNAGRAGDFRWALFAGGQRTNGYPYTVEKEQNEDCLAKSPSGLPESVLPLEECTGEGPSGTIDYHNNYANLYGSVGYGGLNLQAGGVMQEKMKYGLLPNLRFNGPNKMTHYYADLSYLHTFSDAFSLMARAGLNHNELEWDMGVFPLPIGRFQQTFSRGDSDIYRGELTAAWSVVENLFIDLGVSTDQVQLNSFKFVQEDGALHPLAPEYEDYDQSTYSAYGQASWDIIPELTAIVGHRVSRFQTSRTDVKVDLDAGTFEYDMAQDDPVVIQSPRGALVYVPKQDLTFKLLYGEAFRLPNLFETAGTLNKLIIASANIQPERIRTLELGVDTRPVEWLNFRAAVYYSELRDLISRRVTVTANELEQLGGEQLGGVYDNVLDGTVRGAEFSTRAVINQQWSLFANLSAKDEAYEPTDPEAPVSAGPRKLPGFAPITANLGFSWSPLNWIAVHPNGQYVGSRGYSEAYVLANAVVDFEVWDDVTLSFIGNNLADTDYTYPEQVRRHVTSIPGGPGRALYGRVTAEF